MEQQTCLPPDAGLSKTRPGSRRKLGLVIILLSAAATAALIAWVVFH